jgi:hypothetical protein
VSGVKVIARLCALKGVSIGCDGHPALSNQPKVKELEGKEGRVIPREGTVCITTHR